MRSELVFLYKFIYHAQFMDRGAEHELCWVYAGRSNDPVRANANEIADWRYMSPAQLDQDLLDNPGDYSPWMKLEWETIQRDYKEKLLAL